VHVEDGEEGAAEHEAEDAWCSRRGVTEGKKQESDEHGAGGRVREGAPRVCRPSAAFLMTSATERSDCINPEKHHGTSSASTQRIVVKLAGSRVVQPRPIPSPCQSAVPKRREEADGELCELRGQARELIVRERAAVDVGKVRITSIRARFARAVPRR
jgi:hypothetical protein